MEYKSDYFENEVEEIDWMISHWTVGETIEDVEKWYLDNGYSKEALDQYWKESREYAEKMHDSWNYWDVFCDRYGIVVEEDTSELPFQEA